MVLYSWLPVGTYYKNLANWGHIFFMKKFIVYVKIRFFHIKIWQEEKKLNEKNKKIKMAWMVHVGFQTETNVRLKCN
jgi:hypothetical protein